jgi:peptide/nickel transport system substrate-binding protein
VPNFESFASAFKAFRITSEKPLTIEYYTDYFAQDAELNVNAIWPSYSFGEAPWDVIAIANMAEADGKIAYSADKATAKSIEQTSFVGGPSLAVLAGYLDQAIANKTVPYAATLGKYISANEAVQRYTNLKNWYTAHGHFYLGTGPYYMDKIFTTEGFVRRAEDRCRCHHRPDQRQDRRCRQLRRGCDLQGRPVSCQRDQESQVPRL